MIFKMKKKPFMKNYFILLFTICLFTIFACERKQSKKTIDTFKSTLIEKQLPNTKFFISIPADYFIREQEGPDFSLYYFLPTDTLKPSKYSGGLYLGYAPSEFQPDSCKAYIQKSVILKSNREWTINNCKEGYTIQTIVSDNKDSGLKIHAFGNSKNKEDINKVLKIFSTLKHK
jgi:hypothetical protein